MVSLQELSSTSHTKRPVLLQLRNSYCQSIWYRTIWTVAHNETLFSAPIHHLPKCLIHSLGVFSIDETSMSTDMLIPELLGSSVPVTCWICVLVAGRLPIWAILLSISSTYGAWSVESLLPGKDFRRDEAFEDFDLFEEEMRDKSRDRRVTK